MKKFWVIVFLLVGVTVIVYQQLKIRPIISPSSIIDNENQGGFEETLHPLAIERLRQQQFPGSQLKIEQTLDAGINYQRYIASYRSDGLKIYGLLTIPNQPPPETGFPAIIFNHGYIPPTEYRTTERYVAYLDNFARNGYIVFKPDYRGHGNSEGEPSGAYGSNGYLIDVLNALASVKKLKEVNPERVGMWGHSLGGFLTLRAMVISKEIKAGVIWAGVVAPYSDLINNWFGRRPIPTVALPHWRQSWRQNLITTYGTPEENPGFWNSISANAYLKDISGPIQLHHGTGDTSVPAEFSQKLEQQLKQAGKPVELYIYPGDDHNLTSYFNTAMQRSVAFFDEYLKN